MYIFITSICPLCNDDAPKGWTDNNDILVVSSSIYIALDIG